MNTNIPGTGRRRRNAAEPLCQGSDVNEFYSDRLGTQNRLRQTACLGCPILVDCLRSVRATEKVSADIWGLRGGLTAQQRRALRAELLLGSTLDLDAAKRLTSWRWRTVLEPLRTSGACPDQIAAALRKHGMDVSPATARVAVWWLGGRGRRLPRRRPGDTRLEWHLVRDECRSVVERLRELDAPTSDVAAYLGVPRSAVEKATREWNRAGQAAAAAEVELAA